MLLTTKSGQPISMVITKTPRAIPTGKPFVRPDDPRLGFHSKISPIMYYREFMLVRNMYIF